MGYTCVVAINCPINGRPDRPEQVSQCTTTFRSSVFVLFVLLPAKSLKSCRSFYAWLTNAAEFATRQARTGHLRRWVMTKFHVFPPSGELQINWQFMTYYWTGMFLSYLLVIGRLELWEIILIIIMRLLVKNTMNINHLHFEQITRHYITVQAQVYNTFEKTKQKMFFFTIFSTAFQ